MNRPTLKPAQRPIPPAPDKDAAIYRYRVTGVYRVRVFSTDLSDILGAVQDVDVSQDVECTAADIAAHSTVQTLYAALDKRCDFDPLGWKQPPTIEEMGLVKAAKVRQVQASLFDFMGVM